jgi:aminoglycoside 6'-N-acetyltransferase
VPEVGFRPLAAGDLARLTGWLNQPHVTRFWQGPRDPAAVRAHYGPRIDGTEAVHCLVVSWRGRDCGMFQHYRCEVDPAWSGRVGASPGDAGIDYLIGERSLIGRGLGPIMLAAFLDQHVLVDPAVTGIRVDIDAANLRSRRALEKLGFNRVPERDFCEDGATSVVYQRPR